MTANRTRPERESDNRSDNRLTPTLEKPNQTRLPAGWRRGYAADCKSVKTGSIPVPASIYFKHLTDTITPRVSIGV